MKNEKKLSELSEVMRTLNFAIVLFYPLIVLTTTSRICGSYHAYDFLLSVRQIPRSPWNMLLSSLSLYLLLCAVSIWKSKKEVNQMQHRLLICILEILLCLGVTVSLDFYYSGTALLVLADLVRYVRNSVYRFCFAVPLIVLFAFGKYEIIFSNSYRIDFGAFLNYYSPSVQSYFTIIESAMISLNILLFVLYMVLLFVGQRAENVRIRKLNEQLNAANTQLKTYALELERMTEIRERNRLAREIHDTLGHTLTGIIAGADAGLVLFETAPAESKKRLEIIAQSAREGLNDVRRSIHALRPDTLEKHSLEEALENLIENFCLTTSTKINYRQMAGPLDFASDEEDTLYRVIQEGLTNAVRHGKADEIEVCLARQAGDITIRVEDNGCGCGALEEGFGLRHMRERLTLLGGSLSCGNRDGENGFFIAAQFPVREREELG